jgi:hypothetical protein
MIAPETDFAASLPMFRNASATRSIDVPIRYRALCGAVCLWLLAAGMIRAQPPSPERVLAGEFKLIRSGQVWITRKEERLGERLRALSLLQRRIVAAEKALAETALSNARQWRRWQTAEQLIKKLEQDRRNAGNGAERKAIERNLEVQRELAKRLKPQAVEPHKLAGVPQVRSRIIALANDRNALLLSLLWIRSAVTELDEDYRLLGENAEVARAFQELGAGHRLGPLQNYAEKLGGLAEYDEMVFTSRVPMYLLGERLRVSLIVGEQTPATFTWRESHEPTIVTASLAEAAGIPVSESAAKERLSVARGRQVWVRKIEIPYLRVGRFVIRDVSGWLLPPEAEDVGSQIGPVAFSGYNVVARPERFQLEIGPSSER